MKKVFALLLALIMVMSLATTAFAASGSNDNSGSITIDKAHVGMTYSIYQILKMDSYNTDINSYIYSPIDAWKTWIQDPNGGGKYLVLNANGTVKWNGTADQASAAAFVAEALAYAESSGIAANASIKKVEGQDVKFENLNLGYYLVDSSMGAICSLDTVMPNTTIQEKNTPPVNEKMVLNNSGDTAEETSASIGKPVTFLSKITIYPGTVNLRFHDRMGETLKYHQGSVKVYYTPMANNKLVGAQNYDVIETGMADAECDFEVKFDDDFLATFAEITELTVVYTAELTEEAIVGGEPNVNESKITFGDEGYTEWDSAVVKTYKFGIVKTDISNRVLQGAKFKLYYQAEGGEPVALKKDTPSWATDGDTVNYYRPATSEELAENPEFVTDEIEAGKAVLYGIRTGVELYLEETAWPEGYNPLAARYHVQPLTGDNMPTFTAEGPYDKGGVEIENLAGAQLPQTGGMGTTLFYVFGGLMVAAAVVLLVTKKRMTAE